MPNFIDLTGQRFTRFVVVALHSRGGGAGVQWKVKCDCGEERVVAGAQLRCGNSKSCGCLARDRTAERNRKHGQAARKNIRPEYKVWLGMNERCTNPNHRDFHNYGGRGIKVCERWRTFENFFSDMGERPSPRHSIDRKNGNGDYEPTNCRWATPSEQARNKRDNHLVTVGDETHCVAEWAERTGIPAAVIRDRVVSGWDHREAVTLPLVDPYAVKDMNGKRFGRLTVIQRAGSQGTAATWKAQCDCGQSIVVLGVSLRSGKTASCGCLKRERTSQANSRAGREARKAARQCV